MFRVGFGLVMFTDFARYLIAGWVDAYYVAPPVLFKFVGMEWVHPLPGPGMHLVHYGLMVAALAVAAGAAYRAAAWSVAVGHTYLLLLAAENYLNHAYLLSLVALLLACMPAARSLSVDAWRRPGAHSGRAPAWSLWLLRAQLGIVYVYGGLAKVNPDWLAGEPVRGWLRGRAQGAPGWLEPALRSEAMVGLMVHGGLWFDLLVAPALLWRRTRWLAVLASLGFHLGNAWLFNIGVFPWFMLLATTLFFEPGWPRRLPWLGPRLRPVLGPAPERGDVAPADGRLSRGALWLIGAYLLVQILLPLRHHLYPGNVAWTEQGHYFAWRMKLRSKRGSARFVVTSPQTRERWVIDPRDELTPRQTRKMLGKPDLVVQYAHHLARRFEREQGLQVEVQGLVKVSLNHRPRQPLVDPEIDLTTVQTSLWPSSWIMPAPTGPPGRRR